MAISLAALLMKTLLLAETLAIALSLSLSLSLSSQSKRIPSKPQCDSVWSVRSFEITLELSVKSPSSVSPSISSAFGPYSLFQWYQQSKEIL
jgi:hypothetical protein